MLNMKIEEIEKIVKMFEKANITSLDIEVDDMKIKLTKSENQVGFVVPSEHSSSVTPSTSEEEVVNEKDIVKSPLVGTYHQAQYPDAKPFVEVGSKVKKGDKLCIIEAMKVMNEITAPKDGTVKEIYASEGGVIEFDQKLFLIGD